MEERASKTRQRRKGELLNHEESCPSLDDFASDGTEHCVACHEVPGYDKDPQFSSSAGPSFLSIAEDPETYTHVRLQTYLRQPHWPMEQFRLSKSDIDNILALIESLAER